MTLTRQQITIAVFTGLDLWLGAALTIHALAVLGALDFPFSPATYALALPLSWAFVRLLRAVGRLVQGQIGVGMALGTAAATAADGLALRLIPALYGGAVAEAGALILWGAATGLLIGLWQDRGARGAINLQSRCRGQARARATCLRG